MSVGVLYQADILLDGTAATTDMNRVKVDINQQIKEVTAFTDVARHSLPGIYEGTVDGDFFYQTGLNMIPNLLEQEFLPADLILFTPNIVTVGHDQNVGSIVFIVQGALATMEYTGQHGEVLKGTLKFQGGSSLGRVVMSSRLLRQAQSGSSGIGTAQQLGAMTAAQSLYAAMHMLASTSGTGTAFSIISSASSSMPSPTTRITFNSGTSARLGEWENVTPGVVTDTWWAAKWSGFTGTSFTVSISAGIQ